MSNYQKYLAGTSPVNASDLSIDHPRSGGVNASLTWDGPSTMRSFVDTDAWIVGTRSNLLSPTRVGTTR